MAGAASLQREREINSQSELTQIASGYKPPASSSNNTGNNNQGGFGLLALKKDFSGKNNVNTTDLKAIPSTR